MHTPTKKQQLRQLRSKIWYRAVKSRQELNNSQLDILFGNLAGLSIKNSADRVKIFEAIEANNSIPGKGNSKLRSYDLVAIVDSHPDYKGTAGIIRSSFWRLIDQNKLSLANIRILVKECMEELKLLSEEGSYFDDGSHDLNDLISQDPDVAYEEFDRYKRDGDIGYDQAMAKTFLQLEPTFPCITLFGALALEAFEARNMEIAKGHFITFKFFLRQFCSQPWLEELGDGLYEFAVNRMHEALQVDALNGLPSYKEMVSDTPNANPHSPASAFLDRHERLLWGSHY